VAASASTFGAMLCACIVAGADPPPAMFSGFLSDPAQFLATLPAFESLARDPLAAAIVKAGNPAPAYLALLDSLGVVLFGTPLAASIDHSLGSGSATAAALDLGVVLQVAAAGFGSILPPASGAGWEPFAVAVELERTRAVGLRVEPADWIGCFPSDALAHAGSVTPAGGGTPRTFGGALDPINGGAVEIPATLPVAGAARVMDALTGAAATPVAAGASTWDPAAGAPAVAVAPGGSPASASVTFEHQKKLVYDAQAGQHRWLAAPAPTETQTYQPPDPAHVVERQVGITVAQAAAMLGYSYEATGVGGGGSSRYTVENLASFGVPEAAYRAPATGWSSPSAIVYERDGPPDGSGRNFLVTAGAGGYHLRRVRLDGTLSFDSADTTSWGCFPVWPDGLVVHPAGCVVGVSSAPGTLSFLWLPAAAAPESGAPRAVPTGGTGARAGLLGGPVAVAVGRAGDLLVLEASNGRVQALDLWGNPLERFAGSPFLALVDKPGSARYLDASAGADGTLHVLSFTGDGSDPTAYHLDVYGEDGSHLGRTSGVAAAKVAVTLTGDVLALDYEQFLGPGGRTEPAVSLWRRTP
jgi:hypothetical protein